MTDSSPQLADVLAEHGATWQIQADHETCVWTAVQRPSATSLHVLVGHSLADLAAKLQAAGDRASG